MSRAGAAASFPLFLGPLLCQANVESPRAAPAGSGAVLLALHLAVRDASRDPVAARAMRSAASGSLRR